MDKRGRERRGSRESEKKKKVGSDEIGPGRDENRSIPRIQFPGLDDHDTLGIQCPEPKRLAIKTTRSRGPPATASVARRSGTHAPRR